MALLALAVLFGIILLGYGAGRGRVFSLKGFDALNRFAFLVAFPALAFLSLWQARVDLALDWRPYVASLAAIAGGTLAAWALVRVQRVARGREAVVLFGVLFANTSYLGIPLNGLVFGADGAAQAALIAGLLNVTGLPLGMLLVAREEGTDARGALATVARTPLVIAAVLGVVGAAARARWNLPVDLPVVDILAAAAAPVGLFAIGGFFATHDAEEKAPPGPLAAGLAGRLVVAPLVAFAVATATGLTGMPLGVTTAQAAMPVGLTVFVATRALGGDAAFAVRLLLVSLVVGLVPLALVLLTLA